MTPLRLLLGALLLQSLTWWQSPQAYPLLVLLEGMWFALFLLQPGTRLWALLFLILWGWFQAPWLLPSANPDPACLQIPREVRGNPVTSHFDPQPQLVLQRVEVVCADASFTLPSATLVWPDQRPQTWFLPGERIKLKGVILVPGSEGWRLEPQRLTLYNLDREAKEHARWGLYYGLQAKASYYMAAGPARLYLALATADRFAMDKGLKVQIQSLGLSHLFAISGMHIGILYLWISSLTGLLCLPLRGAFERGKLLLGRDLVALALIWGYVALIQQPVSAMRAFDMLCCWLLIRHLLPWQPIWLVLAMAACLILLKEPLLLNNLSFQLSFLSVFALFLLLPLLPTSGLWWRRWLKYAGGLFLTSAWLFAFTLPLVLARFGSISLMAIPANPLHIFFMASFYMPLAMLVLSLSGCLRLLGWQIDEYWLYQPLNALGEFWLWLLDQSAALAPWGIVTHAEPLSPWLMGPYWAVLAGVAWTWGRWKGKTRQQGI